MKDQIATPLNSEENFSGYHLSKEQTSEDGNKITTQLDDQENTDKKFQKKKRTQIKIIV